MALDASPINKSTSVGQIIGIRFNVFAPIELDALEHHEIKKFANAMRLSCRDDIVIRLIGLQHEPHGLHIVAGKPPIPLCIEIPEV